jgi:iron(III) transport system substrate-binding protein
MTERPGDRDGSRRTRRRFLAATGTASAAALAGCSGFLGGDDGDGGDGGGGPGGDSLDDFRGSGANVGGRGEISGTRMDDLPDLSGQLNIYLGGGEGGLYTDLLSLLSDRYPEFTPNHRLEPSAQLASKISEEESGDGSFADVFWAVDAGSLASVASQGYTRALPDDVVSPVPEQFRPDDAWVGVAGRARAVPYNTNQLSESDIPDTVRQFPDTSALQGAMGWAPSYSSFQAFVTAMRLLRGDQATRQWLTGMQDAGVSSYNNEFLVSNAVADGEIAAGFANHYYALRVKAARPDAPIDLAFTSGDAGALVNVSGAEVLRGTEKVDLAENFIAHLLTVEAQEFFATRTFAYPMISGVPPVGGLPRIDELSPPDVDLSQLSDVEGTIDVLRDTGAL